MTLEILSREGEGEKTRILDVHGEVDMDSSPALWNRIKHELKDVRVLKIDLSRVAYLDSSGIAVLIQGFKEAREHGVSYSLLNPSSQVKAVIELAQLSQLFTIEELLG